MKLPTPAIRCILMGTWTATLLTATIYCAPAIRPSAPSPPPEPRRAAPTFVSYSTQDDPRVKCFTIQTEYVVSNPAFSCVYLP